MGLLGSLSGNRPGSGSEVTREQGTGEEENISAGRQAHAPTHTRPRGGRARNGNLDPTPGAGMHGAPRPGQGKGTHQP